jgi:hypothetical protein
VQAGFCDGGAGGKGLSASRSALDEATHLFLFARTGFFAGAAAALGRARGADCAQARPLHHDLMGPVREAIEGAVGEDRIVEERDPLLDAAIAGDYEEYASPPP